ncbi:MAG: dTDP-4-dehydrorhamnose 3,5-epimerase [Clostridiales bacterium]|nr:dTDP-4-dehydrorhamnose 3,5-epimerase [Clostridiales bacterium]
MKVTKTELEGVLIIEPDVFGDNRGWFMESWSKKKYEDIGITVDFVQDNQSFTAKKGTLRGLHFQMSPYAQAKLVRVVQGAVLDVAVDFRKNSPTYLKWVAVELSSENKKQFFIPKGFAHGFLTLTDNVEFVYKCDNFYSKEHDRSVRFDDASIGINWGITEPIVSQKDMDAPLLKDSDCNFIYKKEKNL